MLRRGPVLIRSQANERDSEAWRRAHWRFHVKALNMNLLTSKCHCHTYIYIYSVCIAVKNGKKPALWRWVLVFVQGGRQHHGVRLSILVARRCLQFFVFFQNVFYISEAFMRSTFGRPIDESMNWTGVGCGQVPLGQVSPITPSWVYERWWSPGLLWSSVAQFGYTWIWFDKEEKLQLEWGITEHVIFQLARDCIQKWRSVWRNWTQLLIARRLRPFALQIASKKLNDPEFVEDWLARWKEATVAEVRAILSYYRMFEYIAGGGGGDA